MKYLIERLMLLILVIYVVLVLVIGAVLRPYASSQITNKTHSSAHISCAPVNNRSLCSH